MRIINYSEDEIIIAVSHVAKLFLKEDRFAHNVKRSMTKKMRNVKSHLSQIARRTALLINLNNFLYFVYKFKQYFIKE